VNKIRELRKSTPSVVYLVSASIGSLVAGLPAGTSYFVAVVLVAIMCGRLTQSRGSLARAVYPFVLHLKWGWHRAERALNRSLSSIDSLVEESYAWTLENLPVEPLSLGENKRQLLALDTTAIARLRAESKRVGLLGKGYCHQAGKAVKAHIGGALVHVCLIRSVRVGLLRAFSIEGNEDEVLTRLFSEAEKLEGNYLILADAKIGTKERFAKATKEKALAARLRTNAKLRREPGPRSGKAGRPPIHGAVIHPGYKEVEEAADEEYYYEMEGYNARVRCWHNLHYDEYPEVKLEVLRVEDSRYKEPLLVGTTASELKTEEFYEAYPQRWPVETLFYVGQAQGGTEEVKAWSEKGVRSRVGLGLISASLLKAIAANEEAIAIGPWDKEPKRTAGRLSNFLNTFGDSLLELSVEKARLRNYRKIENTKETSNSEDLLAA